MNEKSKKITAAKSVEKPITATTFHEIMKDLETAEDNLVRILEIASETCEILQDAPLCDHDRIGQLATEYNENLQKTFKLVHNHVDILSMEPKLSETDNFTQELQRIDEMGKQLVEDRRKLDQQLLAKE
jgi:light-regulated signal transduction histidine kinase (bacteriophytochrome)